MSATTPGTTLKVGPAPPYVSPARASGALRGVPGSTLCLRCPPGPASRRQNAGSVPGSLFVRRKGAWHRSHRAPRGAGSGHPLATAPMVRRWAAEGGSEGRCSGTSWAGGNQRQRAGADFSGSDQRSAISDQPSANSNRRSPIWRRETVTDAASGRIAHGHLRVVERERIVDLGSDFKGKTSRRGGDP